MGFASSRLPSTVQINTNATTGEVTTVVKQPQSPVPLRKQVFHEDKPVDARQLNTMQVEINEATLAARTNSRNQSITFEGVVFSLPPVNHSLQHNLGTKVRWALVRWHNSVTAAGIVEPAQSQADNNVLLLRNITNVAGIADVEVWSAT